MAGSKGSKYYNIFLRYLVCLENEDGKEVIGETMIQLLKIIKKENSLMAASHQLNISYRNAWGALRRAEQLLGIVLVEKKRGGEKGGTSYLTPDGEQLIQAFDELRIEFDKAVHSITKKFFHSINKKQNKILAEK